MSPQRDDVPSTMSLSLIGPLGPETRIAGCIHRAEAMRWPAMPSRESCPRGQ